jgi:two-component system, OmpR family, sensor histidine kinase KdpD
MNRLSKSALRVFLSVLAVGAVTFLAYRVIPVNATTAGFGYLLLVLIVASTWGFLEAAVSSLVAAAAFNFFFLLPIGTFTIQDPQNWVAVSALFTTALIGSRLSAMVKRRAMDALERQEDLERLYTFSRAILLIEPGQPFPKQLAQKLAEIFGLTAVVLFDRRLDEFYRAGPSDFEGMDDQLREAALRGTSFADPERRRVVAAVRLGADPIASLALQGVPTPDAVMQGVANLVAIGLERARAQELAHEIEATRQTERLRSALIDAMAHDFKTPLTSIKAATTSLLSNPTQPEEWKTEKLTIADEEADHLRELIDDAVQIARVEAADIDIQAEPSNLGEIVRNLVSSMKNAIDSRPVEILCAPDTPRIIVDPRLIKLTIKQLLDNALKYSPPNTPIRFRVATTDTAVQLEITDQGKGIPEQEQRRIFERFYRIPVTKGTPGSGLGLSIAQKIVHAHRGDLTLTSRPGETTFRMILPLDNQEAQA